MSSNNIPFKVHPRVFSALGAELVTDDIVAVIELVKNSYDAFASRSMISFALGERGRYLSIIDNGIGMNRETIENVWCTLATPYRMQNPISIKDDKKRRVTGAKGLGRLSAAKLGGYFEMITKAESDVAWKVSVDWDQIINSEGIEYCNAIIEEYTDPLPFIYKGSTGTAIYISNLTSDWTQQSIVSLKDNLARLKSPFSVLSDFEIIFCDLGDQISFNSDDTAVDMYRIAPPAFLYNPKYCIKGQAKLDGSYESIYEHRPVTTGKVSRTLEINRSWLQIIKDIPKTNRVSLSEDSATCGPFAFEIRAWDIGVEDIVEISDRYDILRTRVRKDIASHKGISVYRDDILVLPKTDTARDWLKLDLRRVSRVGSRLSTSQIIGFVAITADENDKIKDSSDREKLQKNRASEEFETIILDIIHELEQAREIDRIERSPVREKPLRELFEGFEGKKFLDEYKQYADEGATAKELIHLVEEQTKQWSDTGGEIVRRFVYYSRLATIGSIAEMLIHEIRNNTTNIGRFLRLVREEVKVFTENLEKYHLISLEGVERLEKLSDTFAPLASRSFSGRSRSSNLSSRVSSCIDLFIKELKEKKVIVKLDIPENLKLKVDPAEIDTVLINLLSNALFWINDVELENRIISISARIEGNRAVICFDDMGPGINKDYVDRIFLPGVTSRRNGIGMGLTVASEIVFNYNGVMSTVYPGTLGGASFVFDLPMEGTDESTAHR